MQRFDRIYNPNQYELDDIIKSNKEDGFVVKQMIVVEGVMLFFFQRKKLGRKNLII